MSVQKQDVSSILPEYTIDDLGTSFKVVLVDSVERRIGKNGPEVHIPDFQGLMKKVAVTRAIHPLKLTGGDIHFLRKNLGMKSKELAAKLDISPEHMSRCETGDKILSGNSEKVLRALVLFEAVYVLKKAIEDAGKLAVKKKTALISKLADLIDMTKEIIDGLNISPVHSVDDDLTFHFCLVDQLESSAANDDAAEAPREWSNQDIAA